MRLSLEIQNGVINNVRYRLNMRKFIAFVKVKEDSAGQISIGIGSDTISSMIGRYPIPMRYIELIVRITRYLIKIK